MTGGAGLLIRPARRDEWGVCAALYEKVLRETFTWLPAARHKAADFLAAAPSEDIFVAELDGRLVGVASVYRPQNFIHSLYVTERGRGVGKSMLDHLESQTQGPLSLKVQTQNLRAQAFYLRHGFQPREIGREADGITWMRMVRPRP